MVTKKWPPIDPGTEVRTTRPNWNKQGKWTGCKWGVKGTILTHHDSHGLCYDVRHSDGTVGSYDPSELEIVRYVSATIEDDELKRA